jgi:cell division protease FtsH
MTAMQQESDAVILTRSNLVARLVTAMGGIACEEMMFGEPSTGAENDLEQATDLARDMIGRFGMGTRRRRLLSKESEAFLGDEPLLGQISGQTHHEMENEIDRLLEEAESEATRVLLQFRDVLDVLGSRLETDETLEGPELESILAMVRPEVSLFIGLGDESSGNGKHPTIENFLGAE